MSEYDKRLNTLNDKRAEFGLRVNVLANEHKRIYKKLSSIFFSIDDWMLESQNYMNELKQSIENIENSKLNKPYGGTANDITNSLCKQSDICQEDNSRSGLVPSRPASQSSDHKNV